ncbi:MAG: carbohydrate deacetylase [Clostridiales bacterium]|nr:carbohydrate deacetylase [Clostridiales bacterium]
MQLIVNADDLGYSRGVNCGIADAHVHGVVTSASAMANMPAFRHAADTVRALATLGVGLHFNITCGRPLADGVSTLTDANGYFMGPDPVFDPQNDIDPYHIRLELHAQMQAFLKSGCRPTHIDSHHHVHTAPAVADTFSDFARTLGLPVRAAANSEVALCTGFHAQDAQAAWLISYLDACTEGTVELMTHPGFVDQALLSGSTYALPRAREHAVLTSKEVREYIQTRGIRLIRHDEV